MTGVAGTQAETPTEPAGWYLSEGEPGTDRYWDGHAWTDQTRPTSTEPYRAYVVKAYGLKRFVSGLLLWVSYPGAVCFAGALLTFSVSLVPDYVSDRAYVLALVYLALGLLPTIGFVLIIIAMHVWRRAMRRKELPLGRVPISEQTKQLLLMGLSAAAVMAIDVVSASATASASRPAPRASASRRAPVRSARRDPWKSTAHIGSNRGYTFKTLGRPRK